MNAEIAEAVKRLEAKKAETQAATEKVTNALSNGTITHQIDGFEFKTHATLLPKTRRAVFAAIESAQKSENLDEIQGACAVFMAAVSVELTDSNFWIEYDEATGYLMRLTMHVMEQMTLSEPEIKSFRK